jgi:hypothetical protein
LTLDEVMDAAECDDGRGFCLQCGAEHDGCEPDARRYPCDNCGALAVYGAQEIIIGAIA